VPKFVWKSLPPEDINKLLEYVASIPEGERPLYGLTGKKSSFLTAGTAMWTHAICFTADRIMVTEEGFVSGKKTQTGHNLSDLVQVDVKRRKLAGSDELVLEFGDGSSVELVNVPKTQCDPVELLPSQGTSVFARERLSDAQITNCYYAYDMAAVIPPDLLKKK